jgi:hypothetical protein
LQNEGIRSTVPSSVGGRRAFRFVPEHIIQLPDSGIDRRQLQSADKLTEPINGGKLGGGMGFGSIGKAQPTKAAKVEFIEPKIRKDAKRIRLTYGPYKLRAANVGVATCRSITLIYSQSKTKVGNDKSMDPAGTSYSYMAGDDFPRDVTLLSTTSAIYDEGGKNKIDTAKGLYNQYIFYQGSNWV